MEQNKYDGLAESMIEGRRLLSTAELDPGFLDDARFYPTYKELSNLVAELERGFTQGVLPKRFID